MYITSRFNGLDKTDIESLCTAVRSAGFEDFSLIRDVENYQKTFDDPKKLMQRARHELEKCDALLIDMSDNPSGGRVLEAGMAYALQKPVYVVARDGTTPKEVFAGIATQMITYTDYSDLTQQLSKLL